MEATIVRSSVRRAGHLLRRTRNALEWHATRSVRGRRPWCVDRWGHRYQAVSLADYEIVRDGNPEVHEARLLERTLRPGMTILDVGANHGLFSLEAARHIGPTGRIHAFEPTPGVRDQLVVNLRSNGLDAMVEVIPAAVGAEEGTAKFRVHHGMTALNTMAAHDIVWLGRPIAADEVIEVPVLTLDDHAERSGLGFIDFLKIDVEGFELHVLRGGRGLLAARRVGVIMLEVGDGTCANAGIDPHDVLDELNGSGYDLFGIEPDGSIGERIMRFPDDSFSANYLAMPAARREESRP
jgi:FkbM family methyltransferase